ncbi:hypothetical protein CC1G_05070 [Coprinopsis cinerea okayama7|uniref:BTB domain-containing protein n=1 Tax=Coprinopsis cinerea (strain Okayama-7 / 130 / ATCC MYA-4618 / FGSC 9003) TaxID=240176 RepID=A8NSR6_COPC7|nr:hypothetical protein CC1G_05070 [Coprinopsis cinerea okayama7\|eukprot:XP_001836077.1 hypothetical protein CC1G_05070 [Coprinopsis cinerea okayama7\
MAKETRSAKRKRGESTTAEALTATTSEPASVNIQRSQQVWYDDGNVILQVENRQFRVHKSILSKHSPVLRDMFSMPQPDGQLKEDCPVVVLEHDLAKEWEQVLALIYDGFREVKYGVKLWFSEIRSILSLNHKYDLPSLREEALSRLKLEYPLGPGFEEENAVKEFGERDKSMELDNHTSMWDVVNMATKYRLERWLPAIYLQALMQRDDDEALTTLIFDGTVAKDGTTTTQLEPAIQRLLLKARDRFRKVMKDEVFNYLSNERVIPGNACPQPKRCALAQAGLLRETWGQGPTVSSVFALSEPDVGKLCPACSKAAKCTFWKARVELVKKLPAMFDLPLWEQLKEYEGQVAEDEEGNNQNNQ